MLQTELVVPATCSSGLKRGLVGPYLRAETIHLDETDIVLRYLTQTRDWGVMIDVGAHTGSSCIPFVKSGWRVVAIEPNRINRSQLKNKLAALSVDEQQNIDVHEVAVSDRKVKNATLYHSDVSSGISGLSKFHESHWEVGRVEVDTLKGVLDGYSFENIEFLKIDIEGFDYFALQGFPWNRFKPNIIECEFEDLKSIPLGYKWTEICDYLVGKGYDVLISEWHPIVEYGIQHDWRCLKRYPCELSDDTAWGNVVAIAQHENLEEIVNGFITSPFPNSILAAPNSFSHDRFHGGACAIRDGYFIPADDRSGESYVRKVYHGHYMPGQNIVARLTFTTDVPGKLRVRLIRHGQGPAEHTDKVVTIVRGVNEFVVPHNIQHYQLHFGVQLHCIEPYEVHLEGVTSELVFMDYGSTSTGISNDIQNSVRNTTRRLFENTVGHQTKIESQTKLAKAAFLVSILSNTNSPTSEKMIAFLSLIDDLDEISKSLSRQDFVQLNETLDLALRKLRLGCIFGITLNPGNSILEDKYIHGRLVKRVVVPPIKKTKKGKQSLLRDGLSSAPGKGRFLSISRQEFPSNRRYHTETEYSFNSENTAILRFVDVTTGRTLGTVNLERGFNNFAEFEFEVNSTDPSAYIEVQVENKCDSEELYWYHTKIWEVREAKSQISVIESFSSELARQRSSQKNSLFTPVTTEPLSLSDIDRLNSLRNKFSGERVFIMGNGPSLNNTPLDLLKDDYVFGLNRVSLLFDRITWRPHFFTAFDVRVVPDNQYEFSQIDVPYKFFSARYKPILGQSSSHYWHHAKGFYDGFEGCFDPDVVYLGFGGGGTVGVIAIEIAFFLGFREIYLIGTDVSYSVRPSVLQAGEDTFGDGVKLQLESTKDDDPNHFDPRYFGRGKKWHNPNVKDMKIGFARAASYIQRRGGVLRNATVGGKLDEVPRVKFESLF